MKVRFWITLAIILLFVPSGIYALEFVDKDQTLSFRGSGGGITSECGKVAYTVSGVINSDKPETFKIEIIDPNGKIVGVANDSVKGAFSSNIEVNYTDNGIYLIQFNYRGEIYEKDYSWNTDYLPSHEEILQCKVAKAINSGIYHDVGALNVRDDNYGNTWERNKDELKKILGDELFEYYELIVNRDALYKENWWSAPRMETDLAFKELDKLHALLNDYSFEQYSKNYAIAENQIKKMDISDEDKVNVIYDRRISFEQTVDIYENNNRRFIEQIKKIYLYLDNIDESERQEKLHQLEIEAEKEKIRKELASNESKLKQQIRDELDVDSTPEDSIIQKSNRLMIAPFVDPIKNPRHYIDRYNNEPEYKEWFDENYPEYESIEQAVGLEITEKIPEWVKNMALWYGQGKISEDEFLSAIEFLINEGIINIIP